MREVTCKCGLGVGLVEESVEGTDEEWWMNLGLVSFKKKIATIKAIPAQPEATNLIIINNHSYKGNWQLLVAKRPPIPWPMIYAPDMTASKRASHLLRSSVSMISAIIL